jgi:hypothetical protein
MNANLDDQVKNLENLNEKIKSVQIELNNTEVNTPKYKKIWNTLVMLKDMLLKAKDKVYGTIAYIETLTRIDIDTPPEEPIEPIQEPIDEIFREDTPVPAINTQLQISNLGISRNTQAPNIQVPNIQDISTWLRDIGCDITKYTINIKVLKTSEKESASESIIIFGDMKLNNSPVAFKIVFPSRLQFSNSLDVEQQIYANVTQYMLNNNHSPHLTACIGLVKPCDITEFKRNLSQEQKFVFNKNISGIDSRRYDLNKPSILILSKSGGLTLHDYLTNGMYIQPGKPKPNQISVRSKFNMLFQILYTLRCFERVGLSHNDLHSKNIFVDELHHPHERIYYILDRDLDKSLHGWVKTTIKYDTKIFDFDRGSIRHQNVDRNFTLDMSYCSSFDQCNQYSFKRDLAAILLTFYRFSRDGDHIRKFIESIVVGGANGEFLLRGMRREYVQNNTFQGVDHNYHQGPEIQGIPSIEKCIYKLLRYQFTDLDGRNYKSFDFSTGLGITNGTIYTLPKRVVETFWNPKTIIPRKNLNMYPAFVTNILQPITESVINSLRVNVYNNQIIQWNVYEKEFGQVHFTTNTNILFKKYIEKRKVRSDFHPHVLCACYLLCLPFLYKFNKEKLMDFISQKNLIFKVQSIEFRMNCCSIVDDIWSIFDNELPINLIKM